MTQGKVLEGVFGIHKPTGITSAQALRDLQRHFNPSELFAPWLAAEKAKIARENHNQRQRRKQIKRGNEVKIGHGGTLDPLATGVLIVGVGKGTKELTGFLECTKTYEAVVVFGAATDTYDCAGRVLKRAPYEHITREVVEKALGQYRGKFMQLPPLYSALKMNGKPLYEYAREGKEIPREIERRPVDVLELEMMEWMEGGTHEHKIPTDEAGHAEVNVANKLWDKVAQEDKSSKTQTGSSIVEQASEAFKEKKRKLSDAQDDLVKERPTSKKGKQVPPPAEDPIMSGGLSPPSETSAPSSAKPILTDTAATGPPAARLRMTVTSGFYVRSLCHDLGAAVGSAALMTELIRTRQGVFELGKNVLEYTDLNEGEKVWGPKVEAMIDDWAANNGRPNRSAPFEKVATKEPEQAKITTKETEEGKVGEVAPQEVQTEKTAKAESEPAKTLSTPVEKVLDDKVELPKETTVASA